MYYEPYQKKPRHAQRPRRSFGQWLGGLALKLLGLLLVLVILTAGVLYALPAALFAVEPDGVELSLTDGLPASRLNVLLLGTDVMRDNSQRSDSMIIASVGYGTLKLTSVLRDTVVDIPGHGTGKLNAAYAYGGAELVMKTLNQNFNLNIMHYVCVDFVALVDVVDAIGGVDLAITEAEMAAINRAVVNSRGVFKPLGYTARELTTYGENTHLDGLQALGYARLRKLDSDFVRTSRQRALLKAMRARILENLWNPVMLARLGKAIFTAPDTNLTPLQLISLGEKALVAGEPEQLRLPVEGSYVDNGSTLKLTDVNANIAAFMEFAYP